MSNWRTHLAHIPGNLEATLKSLSLAITGTSKHWDKEGLTPELGDKPQPEVNTGPAGSEDSYGYQVVRSLKLMEIVDGLDDDMKQEQAIVVQGRINKFRGEMRRDLDRMVREDLLDKEEVKEWGKLDTLNLNHKVWKGIDDAGNPPLNAEDEKRSKELWTKINAAYKEWREEEAKKKARDGYDVPDYLVDHHQQVLAVYRAITETRGDGDLTYNREEAPNPYRWAKKGPKTKEEKEEERKEAEEMAQQEGPEEGMVVDEVNEMKVDFIDKRNKNKK